MELFFFLYIFQVSGEAVVTEKVARLEGEDELQMSRRSSAVIMKE